MPGFSKGKIVSKDSFYTATARFIESNYPKMEKVESLKGEPTCHNIKMAMFSNFLDKLLKNYSLDTLKFNQQKADECFFHPFFALILYVQASPYILK